MRCRVHSGRMVDYGGDLKAGKRLLLHRAQEIRLGSRDCLEVASDAFAQLPPEERPVGASIAKSYGKQEYSFMMFEY